MSSVEKNVESQAGDTAAADQLARTILNSLSAHVAILDRNGFILETNRTWMQFAEANQIRMRPDTLKVNYLEICDKADGYSADESLSVARGIRDGFLPLVCCLSSGIACQSVWPHTIDQDNPIFPSY